MLTDILASRGYALTFHLLEVGARPIGGPPEPTHKLLETFPGSRLTAFEVDPDLCQQLNGSSPPYVRYLPHALGSADETRPFYITEHPMCSSLYPPDERWAGMYHNLDYMRLKQAAQIATRRLDGVLAEANLPAVDFIKIDVQGAEVDIFRGAAEAMNSVLLVESEVEFVPLYQGQPLWGDVTACLAQSGLTFHKFLGASGRTIKPIVVNDNPNAPIQMLWADALYIRDLFQTDRMSDEQLLKLAVLAEAYHSVDVAYFALSQFDSRRGTNLGLELVPLEKSA